MSSDFHPEFISRIQSQIPAEEDAFFTTLETDRITSVRLNTAKCKALPFINPEPVPWGQQGYYLPSRPSFVADPLIHAGAYYVQEAASMFVGWAFDQLKPNGPLKVLDICAAPGGKSIDLLTRLSDNDVLIANEVDALRRRVLVENLMKWGRSNTVVTGSPSEGFGYFDDYFDVVLLDAPCSGEGMFRKDKKARALWHPGLPVQCATVQQKLLADALNTLKPGGLIMYSTCTFAPDENLKRVQQMEQNSSLEPLQLKIPHLWGIQQIKTPGGGAGYQFWPHLTKGEGFFITCFKKTGNTNHTVGKLPTLKKFKNNKSLWQDASLPKEANKFLSPDAQAYATLNADNYYLTAPHNTATVVKTLQTRIKIAYAGTPTFLLKGKSIIPEHALALSGLLNPMFPKCNLSLDDALRYLKREPIAQLPECPNDWVLPAYKQLPLGWAKKLPNRLNSHYPQAYKIRKSLDID